MKLWRSERHERKIWKARTNDISSQNCTGFHETAQSFLSMHITYLTSIKIPGMLKVQREIFWFLPLFCLHSFHPFALYPSYCLRAPLAHQAAGWISEEQRMSLRKVIKNKPKLDLNRHRSLTPCSASRSVLKDEGMNHLPFSSTSSYGSGTTSSPAAVSAPATGLSPTLETKETLKWAYRVQEELRCSGTAAGTPHPW